jgi:hypothetical protein
VYGAQPPEEPQWRLPGAEQGADLAGLLVKEQEALLFLGNDAFVFHRLAAGPAPYLPWDDETEELTLYRMGSFGPLEEHERSYIAQEGGEAQYGQAAEKALSFHYQAGQPLILRLYRHADPPAFAKQVHTEGLRLTILGLLEDARAAYVAQGGTGNTP